MDKIVISGFGGQGVLSMGLLVAYSAMDAGLCTTWLPSYGPEMRGGTANCSVAVSDKEIASPVIENPDILVVMNKPSLDKFLPSLLPGSTLVINSSIIHDKVQKDGVTVYYVPVDELAASINKRGANIIMLGILTRLLPALNGKAAENAVREVFKKKPQLIDMNLKCLEFGLNYKP